MASQSYFCSVRRVFIGKEFVIKRSWVLVLIPGTNRNFSLINLLYGLCRCLKIQKINGMEPENGPN